MRYAGPPDLFSRAAGPIHRTVETRTMWCHFLLLVPLVIAGLFIVLPWPIALPIALAVSALTGRSCKRGRRLFASLP